MDSAQETIIPGLTTTRETSRTEITTITPTITEAIATTGAIATITITTLTEDLTQTPTEIIQALLKQ